MAGPEQPHRPDEAQAAPDRPVGLPPPIQAPATRARRALVRIAPLRAGAALAERAAVVGIATRAMLERELDHGRGSPWLAVALAVGIILYFALPQEPNPWALSGLAVALGAATLARRRAGPRATGLAIATAIALGATLATWETVRLSAPRLDRERIVDLTGDVLVLETTQTGGVRLMLQVVAMTARGLPDSAVPRKVNVVVSTKAFTVRRGDRVAMRARLSPPSGPALPGGFDFARFAFFEGRGASGFALGRPRVVPPPSEPIAWDADRWVGAAWGAVHDIRRAVAARLAQALGPETGGIAAAMLVGDTGTIPAAITEPLRIAGLYHVVSISGLHMAMVAGLVLAGLRRAMALSPGFALRVPTKRWAAGGALALVTLYLILSGAAVATQRSYVMIAVVQVGLVMERRALTHRGLAVAALVVLALAPHAVLDPGFQMSFLAVAALVAVWDRPSVTEAPLAARLVAPGRGALGWVGRTLKDGALTALVAGVATAPIIADVFYRAAPYSLIANVIAMPIIGFVIMPFALLTLIAMPFGLDPWLAMILGLGVDAMVAVARVVASLPGSDVLTGQIHAAAAPLAVVGLLWLTLWHERWRWGGLALVAIGMAIAPFGPRPDVLVAADGALVGVRAPDGGLALEGAKREAFTAGLWLTAQRDPRRAEAADIGRGWRCDPIGCAFGWTPGGSGSQSEAGTTAPSDAPGRGTTAPSGLAPGHPGTAFIAVNRDQSGWADDCRQARIVVTAQPVPAGCPTGALVFDATRLAETGAVMLWLDPATGTVARVVQAQPRWPRPWTTGARTPEVPLVATPPAGPGDPVEAIDPEAPGTRPPDDAEAPR